MGESDGVKREDAIRKPCRTAGKKHWEFLFVDELAVKGHGWNPGSCTHGYS